MNYDAQRIKKKYDPDFAGDIAVGPEGKLIHVTWAEFALLGMIETQQVEIEALKAQVESLIEAVPQAGQSPRADGSNVGRNKLFKA